MHIRIHIQKYIYIHTHTRIHPHIHIYTKNTNNDYTDIYKVCLSLHTQMHICSQIYTHIDMYTSTQTYMYRKNDYCTGMSSILFITHTHTLTHTHTHTYMYLCMHPLRNTYKKWDKKILYMFMQVYIHAYLCTLVVCVCGNYRILYL